MKEIIPENNTLIFECPHCSEPVIVYLSEHGTLVSNLKQIDPQEENGKYFVNKCGYI